MKNRIFLLAALLIPLAAHSQTAVKKFHTINLAAHWATSPIPSMDSLTNIIMDTTHGAIAWTHVSYGTGGLTAEQYLSFMSLGATEGFTKTDSTIKTLGGRSFNTVGWKSTEDDDTTGRVRTYVHLNNTTGLLFFAWIVYDDPEGAPAVAEFEAMLGGATVGIRRNLSAWNPRRDANLPRLDVLGRTWRATGTRPAVTPYFLRR